MGAIERPITDPLWKEKAIDRWIGRKETKRLWFPDIVPGTVPDSFLGTGCHLLAAGAEDTLVFPVSS